MDDENEATDRGDRSDPPARTEQLRIVGAEEAGALMPDSANRGGPEGGARVRIRRRRRRRRSPGRARIDDPHDDLVSDDDAPSRRSTSGRPRRDLGTSSRADDVRDRLFESIPRRAPSSFLDDDGPRPSGPSEDVTRAVAVRPAPGRAADRGSDSASARRPVASRPSDADDDDSAWLASLGEPDQRRRDRSEPLRRRARRPGRARGAREADAGGLGCRTGPSRPPARCPRCWSTRTAATTTRGPPTAPSPAGATPPASGTAAEYSDVSDLGDDLPRGGALDEGERPSLDEFFSFEDLDSGAAARRAAGRRADRRRPAGPRRRSEPRAGGGPAQRRSTPWAAPTPAGTCPSPWAPASPSPCSPSCCCASGPAATLGLVAVAVGLAAAELLATARRAGHHPAALVGLAAVGRPAPRRLLAGRGRLPPGPVPRRRLLAVLVPVRRRHRATGAERWVSRCSPSCYVGVLGSFAALILRIRLAARHQPAAGRHHPHRGRRHRRASSSAATPGRSPLSPISPNKTVEGALGGFAAAVIASVAAQPLRPGPAALRRAVGLGHAGRGRRHRRPARRPVRVAAQAQLRGQGHGDDHPRPRRRARPLRRAAVRAAGHLLPGPAARPHPA